MSKGARNRRIRMQAAHMIKTGDTNGNKIMRFVQAGYRYVGGGKRVYNSELVPYDVKSLARRLRHYPWIHNSRILRWGPETRPRRR